MMFWYIVLPRSLGFQKELAVLADSGRRLVPPRGVPHRRLYRLPLNMENAHEGQVASALHGLSGGPSSASTFLYFNLLLLARYLCWLRQADAQDTFVEVSFHLARIR